MEIALPGLENEFDLPANRIHFWDRCRRPYRGRDIGNKEVSCQKCQMGLGRCVAFFLRVLPGDSAAGIDDRLGHRHGNETRGDPLCGPDKDRLLEEQEVGRNGQEDRLQLHRVHTARNRFINGGLMIEATAKIRPSRRKAGESFDLKIASIKDKQSAFLCQGHDRVDISLGWDVPWCQRKMSKKTAFIVPHGLNLSAGFCGTPSRAGKRLVECFRQFKASTVRNIDFAKGRKQAIITHGSEGLEFCQDLSKHVLQKGNGFLVHALMNGFGRDLHRLPQLGALRRQLGQGRLALTPGPKRHQGQKEFPRDLRRALDKAGAPGGGFDVVGRKKVC